MLAACEELPAAPPPAMSSGGGTARAAAAHPRTACAACGAWPPAASAAAAAAVPAAAPAGPDDDAWSEQGPSTPRGASLGASSSTLGSSSPASSRGAAPAPPAAAIAAPAPAAAAAPPPPAAAAAAAAPCGPACAAAAPASPAAYAASAYWDSRYAHRPRGLPTRFDWFFSYAALRPLLLEALPAGRRGGASGAGDTAALPTLHVGCGNSDLSAGLAADGVAVRGGAARRWSGAGRQAAAAMRCVSGNAGPGQCGAFVGVPRPAAPPQRARLPARPGPQVVNTDISPVVIAQMQEDAAGAAAAAPGRAPCSWEVADCRSMPQYEDGAFGAVLDKGTLDAVLCSGTGLGDARAYVSEAHRVLAPGGAFVLVSLGAPDARLGVLRAQPRRRRPSSADAGAAGGLWAAAAVAAAAAAAVAAAAPEAAPPPAIAAAAEPAPAAAAPPPPGTAAPAAAAAPPLGRLGLAAQYAAALEAVSAVAPAPGGAGRREVRWARVLVYLLPKPSLYLQNEARLLGRHSADAAAPPGTHPRRSIGKDEPVPWVGPYEVGPELEAALAAPAVDPGDFFFCYACVKPAAPPRSRRASALWAAPGGAAAAAAGAPDLAAVAAALAAAAASSGAGGAGAGRQRRPSLVRTGSFEGTCPGGAASSTTAPPAAPAGER
jgi:SAM-dependent methyltransferase